MKYVIFAFCSSAVFANQLPVQPNLDTLVYPALARSARIQGTVKLAINAGEVQLISGHPMLLGAARANVERWAITKGAESHYFVYYIFQLSLPHTATVEREKLVGDRLGRFFLRLLRRPVSRKVREEVCDASEGIDTSSKFTVIDDEPVIKVDVTAQVNCDVNTTTYIARSN